MSSVHEAAAGPPRRVDWPTVIGIILAFVVQGAGALMWAARNEERVTQVEKDVDAVQGFDSRLARLETQGEGVSASLERIERRLDAREYP